MIFDDVRKRYFAKFIRTRKETIRFRLSDLQVLYFKGETFTPFLRKDENKCYPSLYEVAKKSYLPWTLEDTYQRYKLRHFDAFNSYRAQQTYPKKNYFGFGLRLNGLSAREEDWVLKFLKKFGVVPNYTFQRGIDYTRPYRYENYIYINEFGELDGKMACSTWTSSPQEFCEYYVRCLENFLVDTLPIHQKMMYRLRKIFNKKCSFYEKAIQTSPWYSR